MNTLIYPLGPDDDFPEMFCADRLYDGEQQFYTPKGEHTNAMLSRMYKEAMEMEETIDSLTDRNQRLRIDNAMLREACAELLEMAESHDPEWLHWPEMHEKLRKLGVEV